MALWNNDTEIQFFTEALKNFASPEQIFYKLKGGYFAYIPRGAGSEGQTLQARNSLIGQFTEKWCKTLFQPIATKLGLYAVNSVVCEELGLSSRTNADLALCTTNENNQRPENIKLIFEVKMSVVSNYKYTQANNYIESGISSTKIPIIILGNSPITDSYQKKVDFLKQSGVVQGFISLNPTPTKTDFIRESPQKGFQTIDDTNNLLKICSGLVRSDMNYFSSMLSKVKLGELIKIANREENEIAKAEKFLSLIRN
ncbi:MAG: hypothetical protein IPO47_13330 [Bacteroidetes bacterium]|nr:hypothetical protein [Bacteroidota bacterium]